MDLKNIRKQVINRQIEQNEYKKYEEHIQKKQEKVLMDKLPVPFFIRNTDLPSFKIQYNSIKKLDDA